MYILGVGLGGGEGMLDVGCEMGCGLGGRAGIEGGRCRLIQIISSMASSMFDNTPWTSIINRNWYHGSRQALKSKKSLLKM